MATAAAATASITTSAPLSAAPGLLPGQDSLCFSPKTSRVFLPSSRGLSPLAGALSSKLGRGSIRRLHTDSFLPVRAVATQESAFQSSKDAAVEKKTKYFFLVANAEFMLDKEEHFQEQMKERLRLFGERNREQDFWIVIEPKFLENFPDITKRLKRPAVALVSTDYLWITFMKLRLDRVLRGEYEAETLAQALKSNPVDLHFEKPQTWTAPYPKYESGWWTPFLSPQEQ